MRPGLMSMRRGSGAGAGRVLILVENLSVPFDRRVWQESLALRDAGWDVSVICPRGSKRDIEEYVEIDGIEIHRYPLTVASGGIRGYAREYGLALWHTRRLMKKVGPVVAIQLGARAGGSQGPVVKSSVRTWYLSLPHLWAVARYEWTTANSVRPCNVRQAPPEVRC